ncbi:MAG: choice-of-anchor D domain-containing protein [Saprospirales bacterium]|nr:choice-of-anchor D domain-containing protein [Saprospirales bacterium]
MRNYIPSLFFILLFPIALLAQPPCGGNNPAGPSPAIFIDSQIGSSFTATASCEGVLDEVEVRAGLFGSPLSAELRIYNGLIGSGGTLVFTQPFTLTSGNNMIDLVSTEGNPAPCLEDGDQYTFTIASANLFFLWGFNANNYAGGASYTSFGGYNAAKDLWFSFTAVEPGEIDLTGLGNSIPNGDVTPDVADDTDFGIVEVGNTPVHTFTIQNIGAGDLHLTGVPEVQLSGDPEFTVSSQPAGGTLMNAETQDFDITFTPVSDGVVSTATVTIHSSDCDEDTYTFVIQGEGFICDDPDVPTLSASANNVCPETDVTLSVLSGNLNDASDWVWYDDVCGGNQVGTGLSIQVSPLSTTTYYVRGEGGCIVPGTCGDITLIVDDNEDPGITCPDPITLQADANCEVLIPDLTLLDGEVLANSAADFSGTQGQDGWSYGYYAPNDPDGFTQLDPLNFNMNIWMGVQTGGTPSLDSNGGEPGIDDGVWAVRRWVSDFTGQVTISGMYFDRDLNCGDGSNVRIFHNGTQVFLAFSIPGTTTNYTIDLQVGVGDQLDFIIDPLFDTACDDTELTTEITVNSGLMISDNCSLDDVVITQDPLAGTPAGPGVTSVELTATDGFGNTATCNVDLTIEDNIDPTALCQDATVTLDATGNGSVSAAQIDDGSNDGCGIASLSLDETAFDCSNVGINAVLLTVEDNNGNTSTCMATVTVEDTTDPEALCQDATVTLDATGNGSISAAQIDNGSNDACGIASLSLDETAFDCSEVGANTVTLTVEDNNGNTSTCMATVTVEDTTDPQALCQDATVTLDATGNGSVSAAQIDDGSNDACGIAGLSLDETAFDCSDVGANTVILTVEDNNGNTSTCTAIVTVEDTTDPQALCQDATVTLDATGNGSISAAQIDNGSNDACGIASLSLDETAFDCSEVGANTVTLTVEDNNGNTSTCAATVTVEDTTDPEALCQDITLALDANGFGAISAMQIDNGSNDACGVASLSVFPYSFDCSNIGDNIVTLTVTDDNWNMSTCTATVTVEDITNPDAICQDITVTLDNTGNATITAAQVDGGSFDACGIAEFSVDPAAFNCSNVGANIVTLTVTDVYWNESTCTATVTVEDDTNPEALCQDATVTLSNDACGIASLSLDETAFDCSEVGANTVTLTVTDNNGNTSTCAATVTVEDTTDPQALCQDATVALDATGNGSVSAAQIDDGSNDACGIASLSLDETAFDCSDVGINAVLLTVTDNNGNTSTCTATVTVEDITDPQALCQDATVTLDASGNGSISAAQIDNGSNDACGILSLSLDETAFDCSNVGINAVLLTVEDNNGNTSTCSATVTVEDTTDPEALCQDITIALDPSGNASISAAQIDNGSNDACGIASSEPG